jgi:serine/threonine-protein kinase
MIIAGQWEVIEPLGEGGMGMVYKVRHFQMQEIVLAVKMLSPELMDNQALLARFHREGAVMARFRHKHIVRVFSKGVEYDESIKRYFILMEYIQGKTLRDHLRDLKLGKRKPFSLTEIVAIARQVAEALAHAHNQTPPIVHRDIKPGNIMLEDPTKDFPFGRAVVMDWGIAKELKDSDDTQLTGMWTMVGTPKYCSPEQMRPLEVLTGSADIYSLGMVIYELYTGKQFFADLDTESVVRQVRDDPTEHEPHFDHPPPPEFVALIRRAIAKSRTRRYQRVEEFLRDLELCRGASEEKTATTVIRPTLGEAGDREEQRRRLEEQQRAITLDLQREAQRVRERAVYEGAEEGAATFRQAVQQEEEGAKRLGERNYFLAQDAYNEAIRLFERAREEAVAAAQRRAELARDEMAAVKREAERYHARERARRFYTSGLALENEAGELWEQKRYRQAADSFARAKSAFEDAREFAAETLRTEIAAVRERVEAGHQQAVAEDAATLAPIAFAEAERQTQQAAEALEREDFTLARQLYDSAMHQYAQAQRQAQAERQRREIAARQRREADDARQRAQDAKAAAAPLRVAVEGQWTVASQWEQQGQEAYQNERYEEAQRLYAQAAQGYDQARAAAEQLQHLVQEAQAHTEEARVAALEVQAREYAENRFQPGWEDAQALFEQARREAEAAKAQARQAAEQAREDAFSARQEAESGKALFPERWTQAQALCEQAAQAAGREEYGPARELFAQAAVQFRQVLAAVQRRAADDMRQQLVSTKAAGEGLQKAVEELWADAQQWEQRGEEAYQNEQYDAACGYYEQAVRGYREAQAEGERRRQVAQAAHAQAVRARQAAEEALAGEYAQDLFQQGYALQQAAEHDAAQRRYGDAAQQYAQAVQRYEEAQAAATERRRLHDQAVTEQGKAEKARQEAVDAHAEQYVPELFALAQAAFARGEQFLIARRWGEAGEQLAQAFESFARARQEAEREKERAHQEADAARREAVVAREAAAEGEQLFAERWAEGQALLDQADRAFAHEDYPAARAGFRQAHVLFQRLHQEVRVHRQREQAERARARAHELRHQTATVRGKPKRRVDKALASGDALLRQGKYTEAQTSYEEVVSLLTALQQSGAQVGGPTAIPGPAVLVSGGGVALGVAIALYWAMVTRPPAPVTPEAPQIARPPVVLDKNTETRTPKVVQPPVAPPQEPVAPSLLPETTQPPSPTREDSPRDVNRPPVITKVSPKAGTVALTLGETTSLTVQAADPDTDDRLTYVWSMDGQEMSRGAGASWRIPDSVAEGQHQVRVEVVDAAGLKSQVAWNVTVKAPTLRPRITDAQPRDKKVVVQSGTPLDFSVTADVVGGPAAATQGLTYQWSVNNGSPRKTDAGRFRFTETRPGTYKLSAVAVGPDGQQSAAKTWIIEVRARELPSPAPGSGMELTETEVLDWLEKNYRQAWEGKDVDALVRLGVVPSQEAERLKAILSSYKSFRVALRDVDIQKNGKNRATVKFTRVDTVDGRPLAHPPMQLVIEKLADGRITRR